ncbi:MAG TPA: hypothetical protein PKK06_09935 [Phycisphaerae bacterium]|nr:hypothetical protein [Phycisphaerae bacterium]HNU45654.1 hypothetical protein [Phycisphaerae bacterium]
MKTQGTVGGLVGFSGMASLWVIAVAASAGEVEVIFSEAPGHPTAVVPGALDLSGNPVFTEFKALEDLGVSPDGTQWIIKGRNWLGADLEIMMLRGSGDVGAVFAQEGQPVHDGAAGEVYDFFSTSPPWFNELNQFVYVARARGGISSVAQKGIFFDGTTFNMVRQQSDPALGLIDLPPNPSGDELFGNSLGSMHVLNNGTFGYQDSTLQNLHSTRRPAIFYNDTSFRQSGVSPIGGNVWDFLDANTFWTTPDGAHWIAQGDDEGDTSQDVILVVDDQVVLRENTLIPNTTITMAAVFHTKLVGDGTWYCRGDDPSDNDWALRSGELVAASGDLIITDSTEHWTDTFYAFAGNTLGDWVLAGTTDNGNTQTDSVIVLNGEQVVVREGDPVDLDGNGLFDDDAFIGRGTSTLSAFHPNDIYLSDDLALYFFASLRNAAGEDLGTFGTGGDAFLRKCLAPAGDGDYDGDGDVDLADFAEFQACFNPAVVGPGCQAGNLDGDCDVDLDDYTQFATVLSGPT